MAAMLIAVVCAFGSMGGAVESRDMRPISAEILDIGGPMTMRQRRRRRLVNCRNGCRFKGTIIFRSALSKIISP